MNCVHAAQTQLGADGAVLSVVGVRQQAGGIEVSLRTRLGGSKMGCKNHLCVHLFSRYLLNILRDQHCLAVGILYSGEQQRYILHRGCRLVRETRY